MALYLKIPHFHQPPKSLKELLLIIIIVAVISVMVTYEISKRMLHEQLKTLKLNFEDRNVKSFNTFKNRFDNSSFIIGNKDKITLDKNGKYLKKINKIQVSNYRHYDPHNFTQEIGTKDRLSWQLLLKHRKETKVKNKTKENHRILPSVNIRSTTSSQSIPNRRNYKLATDEIYDDLNIPAFDESYTGARSKSKDSYTYIPNKEKANDCSRAKSDIAFISEIIIKPSLNMTPKFTSEQTEYHIIVPYELVLIQIYAVARSCNCEARLESKFGPSGHINYTLGLGQNYLSLFVVDITHSELWIVNTYSIFVHRKNPDGISKQSDKEINVCELSRECHLKISHHTSCPLSSSKYKSWSFYTETKNLLPNCTTGDAKGRWLVPCYDCHNNKTCDWSKTVWQPINCNHPHIPRLFMKSCLSEKKLLFIGDSTNRGIMHYIMEQANDTLTEWDKTHNLKVYTNINQKKTSVSFVYYPQFWLPNDQRPVFDKALYQLIKKNSPLENNHNTILIIGGVHWLAAHHLNVVIKALKREKLSKIKIIIKTLGAGFHQPVDGVHCLTQKEQKKLTIHNQNVINLARKNGFYIVDTFNMTMARYRDFMQGKCACHFHRVKETLPSFTQYLQTLHRIGQNDTADMPIIYHVEGPINAAYSEIILNQICDYQ